METITARSEILQKLLPLYDGSATGQQNFYQTIQQCLSFPLARDVLISFNVHRLLALKATSRVSISGTKYHIEKSADERASERDERNQLAQCLDQLLMPGVKMGQTIRQVRQFAQSLFDGFLNRDIAPRIIHSALPKALYDIEILSSSTKAAPLVDKFGLFYIVCDLCYLALSLHNIAPGAGSPEYVFCHELAKVTLSILSNMARFDVAYIAHIVKAHGLTELFGATLKSQVSQQLLNQLCLLLRLLFKPSSPPFRIELIDALIHARLDVRSMPNGVAKSSRLEALSNTLWVATSLPAVASHAIQNFDFLKVISDTIKLGPDEHSEPHTGILANCLAQKYIDPGLLKPVIQTILKLLKSTQSVTNCLRIISVIAQTPRGAEILLQEKTDLYLRVLIQQQTNQERVKCAQDICRRLGEFNHQNQQNHETGFAWGKVHKEVYETPKQQNIRQMQYEDNDEQPIDWSRIDQNQTKPGYYEPTISKKPMPRPKSQPPSHFKVNNGQQWAKYKPDSEHTVHVEMDEENEEKPNNYSVEDTPGMTPREQSPILEKQKESGPSRGKSPTVTKSGYTSGIQSGARTPAIYQATPLMYSRQSTPESIDVPDIDLSRLSESEHGSAQMSGQISPSEIPDSPGQLALERHKQQMQNRSDETRAVESSKPLFPPSTQTQSASQPPQPVVSQSQPAPPQSSFVPQQPLFSQPPQFMQTRPFAPATNQPQRFPTFSMANQQPAYYQPFTGGYDDDDDDDGPVAFAEEGSMSPRSHAQLSEMTIDSTKHETIDEEKKSEKSVSCTGTGSEPKEDSFFMHKDDTIIAKDETIVDNKPNQEDDVDLLDDLMNTGLNSITSNDQPTKSNTKRVPKLSNMGPNQPGEAENFFESLEKKMAESEKTPKVEKPQTPLFKVPPKKDSPDMTESAKYCNEFMNSDSIKPYNSEGTPAGGSEHTTLSNITIDSELSTAQKKMEALNLNRIQPVQEFNPLSNIPDGQSDSSAPTMAPPPPVNIDNSSRGELKVFNQVEDTPIKDFSRPDSELSSLSFHSSSSEVDLEALATIGLPPQKTEPHPHQIIQAQEFQSPYNRPEMMSQSRSRKAESLPEAHHNPYTRGGYPRTKSEMGDQMTRIPISNHHHITHRNREKSRKRGDQSSGGGDKRSRSSASSRQSKNQDRQKSSVQKVYPPVTIKPKPITSTPHTPTRGYSQFDGLQGKPSTPKTPKSPKGRMNPIGSIKKLLNGDSKSSHSERKKSSSNSLNSELRSTPRDNII